MKLLRITAKGLPLFKDEVDVNFVATQRVSEDDKNKLYRLFSNVYLNPTAAFIGINASGKTTTLRLIAFTVGLADCIPLNQLNVKNVLGDAQNAVVTVYFFSEKNNEICKLETTIAKGNDGYFIKEESLKTKKTSSVKSRKELFNFDRATETLSRAATDADDKEEQKFLPDDVSIAIAYNRQVKERLSFFDTTFHTDVNIFAPFPLTDLGLQTGEIPASMIAFLDPSIERLKFEYRENTCLVYLKFVCQDKELVLNNPIELSAYLSSGTIKGINVFTMALRAVQLGGIIIVDEIENHFNKEIVATLIRFFMDMKINQKGAVLVFSTHYPELLDEYDRNDGIFITRNQNGITAENLSNVLTRNDIKKSEAYQSGFLGGTTPRYEAYVRLKKYFQLEGEEGRK